VQASLSPSASLTVQRTSCAPAAAPRWLPKNAPFFSLSSEEVRDAARAAAEQLADRHGRGRGGSEAAMSP